MEGDKPQSFEEGRMTVSERHSDEECLELGEQPLHRAHEALMVAYIKASEMWGNLDGSSIRHPSSFRVPYRIGE